MDWVALDFSYEVRAAVESATNGSCNNISHLFHQQQPVWLLLPDSPTKAAVVPGRQLKLEPCNELKDSRTLVVDVVLSNSLGLLLWGGAVVEGAPRKSEPYGRKITPGQERCNGR